MALHAMIDLETLGTRPDGVILSVGGVKFDPNGSKIIDEFYYKLDVDEQTERGRSIDESTIEWWGTQDPAVFSVSACTPAMARQFATGYFPDFVVERIQRVDSPETTHFSFAEVNPVISARFHLGLKRKFGAVVCPRRQHAHR